MHIFPQLRKAERKYARELAVIGVHSAKFAREKLSESIHDAAERYGIGHPVVNDRDFRVWQSYAVRAWPTLMFIDPRGKVIGKHEGELQFEPFDRLIGEMVTEFEAAGVLDRRALGLPGQEPAPPTPLLFPGKVLADEASGRLFVTDTGHHRIIEAGLDGSVRRIIGCGKPGLGDGVAEEAYFHQPQGLALADGTLYVADTENHVVRTVELATGRVSTIAGTGQQLVGERVGGLARRTALSSPWDLTISAGVLYVAMAGTHQLWAMVLGSDRVGPPTGTGREALEDGPRQQAAMNQPSGLTTDGVRLYVADSEASAIRMVEPAAEGVIRTIVGEGLFEFGDRDGTGPAAVRLQHPLGVVWHEGALLIADTYNHKIKRLDSATAECRTIAGDAKPGLLDGEALAARFSEPSGLTVAGERVFIADTNNHAVRVLDLARGHVGTLTGLTPPSSPD